MNAPFNPNNETVMITPVNDQPVATPTIMAAAEAAADRIAPLWPLKTFVAVNPFLGFADHDFAATADLMGRRAGARTTMSRSFYREAFEKGRFGRADIAAALAEPAANPASLASVDAIIEALKEIDGPAPTALPLPSTLAAGQTGTDWPFIVADHLSRFLAARFDEGHASWRMPFADLGLWQAFKAKAALDPSLDIAGLQGFRALAAGLPDDGQTALEQAALRLGVDPTAQEALFHRALMTMPGWSGFLRHKVWSARLGGGNDAVLVEFLAIILTVEAALVSARGKLDNLGSAWVQARSVYVEEARHARMSESRGVDLVLQTAFERAWQRDLANRLSANASPTRLPDAGRKAVQAVFCIDVRSEVYRRALEVVAPDVATYGFAGFFGFALGYLPFGASKPSAMCPVLLSPKMIICEDVTEGGSKARTDMLAKKSRLSQLTASWSAFKQAAVSSFGFVEAAGVGSLGRLIGDTLPSSTRIDNTEPSGLRPVIDTIEDDWLASGIAPADRLAMAEGVLKAMSLTEGFAQIVLLVGHGSSSANNPHAAGLDCGACGGHAGDINARVACAVLNDPDVRSGLVAKGIVVPADTIFVPALHDTTRDEVSLLDTHLAPSSHADDLTSLTLRLAEAGHLARAERAAKLHLAAGADTDAAVLARSVDWSQVRPEWGLAGCAAFIAAPRSRTAGVDLGGRAFLHSYDWQADAGFGILELIMTAPMVVASWINLQYYGSAVDNAVFGSGNKVLHNVAGRIGVLEGHGGDLRPGLAMQSVHDGEKLVHEPMRLNVVIEAPTEAINGIIGKHAGVANLLDNGWVHLFAMNSEGRIAWRYDGKLSWDAFTGENDERMAA